MIRPLPDRTAGRPSNGPGCDRELRLGCAEVLRGLAWPDPGSSQRLRTLGITSSWEGEGVSTIAAHLAATAAEQATGPVLIVDCNLACPAIHEAFGVGRCPGLIECVDGSGRAEPVRAEPWENLFVLPAGELRGSPVAVWNSPAMPGLLKDLASGFALVVLDMPPAGRQSGIARLAALADGVLLVVEAERTCWESVREVKEWLAREQANLLGAVLNKRRQSSNRSRDEP